MPPVAIAAGAAVVGAGASIIGANQNKKAIDRSTDASVQSNREAIAAQERIAKQQIEAQQKALEQGLAFQTNALNQNTSLQTGLYNSSGQMQADLYNQRTGILQPWAAGGGAAFNQINAMLGLPGQKFTAPSQIAFSPVAAPVLTAPTPPVTAPVTGTPTAPGTPAAPGTPTPTPQPVRLVDIVNTPEYRAMSPNEKRAARIAVRGS